MARELDRLVPGSFRPPVDHWQPRENLAAIRHEGDAVPHAVEAGQRTGGLQHNPAGAAGPGRYSPLASPGVADHDFRAAQPMIDVHPCTAGSVPAREVRLHGAQGRLPHRRGSRSGPCRAGARETGPYPCHAALLVSPCPGCTATATCPRAFLESVIGAQHGQVLGVRDIRRGLIGQSTVEPDPMLTKPVPPVIRATGQARPPPASISPSSLLVFFRIAMRPKAANHRYRPHPGETL